MYRFIPPLIFLVPQDSKLTLRSGLLTVLRVDIKKADKGTPTVIMNKEDKIREGQVLLDKRENYESLALPMVTETSQRVKELITALCHGNHIDEMTEKWLSLTPNPPRIPVFYTLTKIHKPNPVGRPIISGCDSPTERISSFVDYLLQPIAKVQESYLKDTTDFLTFIEKTKVALKGHNASVNGRNKPKK